MIEETTLNALRLNVGLCGVFGDDMKLCINCKHARTERRIAPKPHNVIVCTMHKKGKWYLRAQTVRGFTGIIYCGKSARHFEPHNVQIQR